MESSKTSNVFIRRKICVDRYTDVWIDTDVLRERVRHLCGGLNHVHGSNLPGSLLANHHSLFGFKFIFPLMKDLLLCATHLLAKWILGQEFLGS